MSNISTDCGCDWIISKINYDYLESSVYRFYGTEDDVRKKLLELVDKDRIEDAENWWHGTEEMDDIDKTCSWEFYAEGVYMDDTTVYSIEYIATKFAHIDTL